MRAGGKADSMIEETNAADSGADQPRSFDGRMYRDSHEVLLIRIVSVRVEHRAPRRRAAFSKGDHRADRLALVHQNVAAAPRTAERRALRARKSPGTGPPERRRNG